MDNPLKSGFNNTGRLHRVQKYRLLGLQRKLADISSQTEATVIEGRNLISWKACQKPRPPSKKLNDTDKRSVESSRRNRLADIVLRSCSPLLKLIISHKWSFPFMTPVDVSKYPDYLNVVSTPMDLGTMRLRMESNGYKDPKDFWKDLNLVFDNAKRYNPAGSDCFLMAQTLQEMAQERYEKTVLPRLAEDERLLQAEAQTLKRKQAAAEDAADIAAAEQQCAKIIGLIDELQAAVLELRSEAASLCELVSPEEKQQLLSSLLALPTQQLEAAVAFVYSQYPGLHKLPPHEPAEGETEHDATAMPRVQLVLGQYDAVLLRQLEHLTQLSSSTTSTEATPAASAPSTESAKVQQATPAAAAPSTESAKVQQATDNDQPQCADTRAAAASPLPPATENEGAASASAAPPVTASTLAVEAKSPHLPHLTHTAPALQGPEHHLMDVDSTVQAVLLKDVDAGEDRTAPLEALQPDTAEGAATVLTPLKELEEQEIPLASNQRLLSDVMASTSSFSVSKSLGVAWPGILIGSGIRARHSAKVDTGAEAAAAAAAQAAAASAAMAAARKAAMTAPKAVGIKRKAPTPIQVEFAGGAAPASAHGSQQQQQQVTGDVASTPGPGTTTGASLPPDSLETSAGPLTADGANPSNPSSSQTPRPMGTAKTPGSSGLVSPRHRGGGVLGGRRGLGGGQGSGRGVRKALAAGRAAAGSASDPAAAASRVGTPRPPSQHIGAAGSLPGVLTDEAMLGGGVGLSKKSVAAVRAAAAAGSSKVGAAVPGLPSPTSGTPSAAAAALAAALNQMGRNVSGQLLPTPPLMPGGAGMPGAGKLSAQQAAAVTAAFGHHQIQQAIQAAAAAAAAKGQFSSFPAFANNPFASLPAPILDLAKGMTQMAGLGNLQATMFGNAAAAAAAAAAASGGSAGSSVRPPAPNVAAAAAAAVAAAAAAGLDSSSPHHQQQLQVLQAAHLLQQHALAAAASQQAVAQGQVAAQQLSLQQASAQQAAVQQQKSMVLDLSAGKQAAAIAAAAAAAAAVGVTSSTAAQTLTLPVEISTAGPSVAEDKHAEEEKTRT